MNIKRTFVFLGLAITTATGFAQKTLDESEIKNIASKMENDWLFGFNHVVWMENQRTFSEYLNTIPLRCPYELENVVSFSKDAHDQNQSILQLKKQIYTKPGSKKSERALALYFKDTDKAKEKFAAAEESERMYEQLIKAATPLIESQDKRTFTIPEGELTYFHYHLGGGMVYKPASEATLERQKDGSYLVAVDTEEFNKLDTIPLTQAQVDTVRQMLIDGEIYKMPRLYDDAVRILDAPSGSVAVEFSDVSYTCNNLPPSNWGGKNIYKVYQYLKALQPKHGKKKE